MIDDDPRVQSTTSPQLCGDNSLSMFGKLKYIIFNYFHNIKSCRGVDREIKSGYYTPRLDGCIYSNSDDENAPSPARFISDMFWRDFNLDPIVRSNGPLRILEVGCGSGKYGLMLQRKLGNDMLLYRGVDIVRYPSWASMPAQFEFFVDSAENVAAHLSDIDLIITQSAVEHFEYDLAFFHLIARSVRSRQGCTWQVHLVPSAECLMTYLWHGYRQYTQNSLSQIARLFITVSDVCIYRLGGSSSNVLHLWAITLPNLFFSTDFRMWFPKCYKRMLEVAIRKDARLPNAKSASFYALVIKTEAGGVEIEGRG